jgi:hypothetical protein
MGKSHLLEKRLQWENKWDPPKLVPDKREWEVDEEEFKQFETVVNFLRLTLFGVCDRSRLAQVYLLDRTRYQTSMPSFHVPKTDFDSTERETLEALDLAQANAGDAQSLVDRLQKNLTRTLQERYKREDRQKKAKGCEICKGKGWLQDEKAFKALGPGMQNHSRRDLGGYNRVFCACQEKSDD